MSPVHNFVAAVNYLYSTTRINQQEQIKRREKTMSKKKIIIIGSGIAGLSAGCYLQINGYDTEIFELHNTPGGLCTAWKRNGYTFDGCIHSLGGLNSKFKM